MRKCSIRAKIIGAGVAAVFVTVLAIALITSHNQRRNLLDQSGKTLKASASILNLTVRNLMLAGEAQSAVGILSDLKKVRTLEEVEIYRTDGSRAFHDYATLERVNDRLQKAKVQESGRAGAKRRGGKLRGTKVQDAKLPEQKPPAATFPKTGRLPDRTVDSESFRAALESNSPKLAELSGPRSMEYYAPILNLPECGSCHGADHAVRGVSYFKISTRDIGERVVGSNAILAGVFVAAGISAGLILLFFLERVFVNPLREIGGTLRRVSGGDATARVGAAGGGELGELGREIDAALDTLDERLRLSGRLPKIAGERVRNRGEGEAGVEKRRLTVLFSGVRGFDLYADVNPPRRVVETLNTLIEAQTATVERWGGDVDRISGGAVVATFSSEHKAAQCAYHMIRSVVAIDRKFGTGLRLGIGVCTGEVVRGGIGSGKRLEGASVGEAVSAAARLSNLAKADMVLLSESSVEALSGKVQAKLVPRHSVKEKTDTSSFFVMERVLDDTARRWVG